MSDSANNPWGRRLIAAIVGTIIYFFVALLVCGLFECSWRIWQCWKKRQQNPPLLL